VGNRAVVAVLCFVLIGPGCSSNDETPGADGSSSTPRKVGVFEVAGGCDGLGKPRRAQVSFVSEGAMFVARPTGTVARCAIEIDSPGDLEWGPEGDRLHFGDLCR
jgi:hypothetical protein